MSIKNYIQTHAEYDPETMDYRGYAKLPSLTSVSSIDEKTAKSLTHIGAGDKVRLDAANDLMSRIYEGHDIVVKKLLDLCLSAFYSMPNSSERQEMSHRLHLLTMEYLELTKVRIE